MTSPLDTASHTAVSLVASLREALHTASQVEGLALIDLIARAAQLAHAVTALATASALDKVGRE